MLLEEGGASLGEATRLLLDSYEQAAKKGLDGVTAHGIPPARVVPRIGAVDGGSCTVLDVSSCGCLAARAAYTVRQPRDAFEDGPVVASIGVVTRRDPDAWWASLTRPYAWGARPELPSAGARGQMTAWSDAARQLLEYHVGRQCLTALSKGDVLLLDGAIEAENPGDLGLGRTLVERAGSQGVHVVAVSKDTSRSIHGVLPFTLEVEEWASAAGRDGAFFADVTQALRLDSPSVLTLAVRWTSHGPVFRVDVAETSAARIAEVLGIIAVSCNDPSVPGYPYPLARVHNLVRYEGSTVADLRRSMEATVSERKGSRIGMRLFGRGRDVLDLGS